MTRNGVQLPTAREVDLLKSYVINQPYSSMFAHPETKLAPGQQRRLDGLLHRRRQGQPLAYLTGTKEFFGRPFIVTPKVLVPRPETECLVATALTLPIAPSATVADIGTGSGCVAITLALARPRWRLIATDRSTAALAVARRNLSQYQLKQRTSLLRGDLLAPLLGRRVEPNLIIANLPYATPAEYRAVKTEPRVAIVGGHDGLAVFRRFWKQLAATGWRVPVVLEIDPRRRSAVAALARRHLHQVAIQVTKDLAGHDRVLTIIPGSVASGT